MLNDKEISSLISQSLRRKLNDDESAAVESHLRESDEARKYAELSALIQLWCLEYRWWNQSPPPMKAVLLKRRNSN